MQSHSILARQNTRFGGALGVLRNRTDEFLKRKVFKRNQKISREPLSLATTRDIYKLPPRWIDFYEEVRDKVTEIRNLTADIQKLGEDRMRASTRTTDSILEQRMQQQIDLAMHMIKECEQSLNRLGKDAEFDEDESDQLIRANIQMNLAQQISDITYALRSHQKKLFDSLNVAARASNNNNIRNNNNQEHTASAQMSNHFLASDTANQDFFDRSQGQRQMQLQLQQQQQQQKGSQQFVVENIEIEFIEYVARDRNARVDKIVTQIKELSELFREMNRVVIEQGTLFDRIDFNLQKMVKKTDTGKKQLQKLNERHQKSDRVQVCICCLLSSIIIVMLILILKFTVLS